MRPGRTISVRLVTTVALCAGLGVLVAAQQPAPRFGGAYSALDARRQALVKDWVSRFVETTGQAMDAGPFYDEIVGVSTKTTFEAVRCPLKSAAGKLEAR